MRQRGGQVPQHTALIGYGCYSTRKLLEDFKKRGDVTGLMFQMTPPMLRRVRRMLGMERGSRA